MNMVHQTSSGHDLDPFNVRFSFCCLSEEGGKVIKASKTIDEALNEIDDSYGKHRQSKENNQQESTTNAVIRENRSELKKAAKNHSDARNPGSEKQRESW